MVTQLFYKQILAQKQINFCLHCTRRIRLFGRRRGYAEFLSSFYFIFFVVRVESWIKTSAMVYKETFNNEHSAHLLLCKFFRRKKKEREYPTFIYLRRVLENCKYVSRKLYLNVCLSACSWEPKQQNQQQREHNKFKRIYVNTTYVAWLTIGMPVCFRINFKYCHYLTFLHVRGYFLVCWRSILHLVGRRVFFYFFLSIFDSTFLPSSHKVLTGASITFK